MPRLSEPMREALEAAANGGIIPGRHGWRVPGSTIWMRSTTIAALRLRGFLHVEIHRAVITPAGREAIGMKEGEDNG